MNTSTTPHVIVALDRSGSMALCMNDTINGFNNFIKTQSADSVISFITFNESIEHLFEETPIQSIEYLDNNNYKPHGQTALYDCIGTAIQIGDKHNYIHTYVVIITDGQDNCSHEYTQEMIQQSIGLRQYEKKWEFIFIGAN